MKPPHKIALLTTELSVGGAEKCLVNLACHLDRARFEPRFYVLAAPPGGHQRQLLDQLESAGIDTEFLGLKRAISAGGARSRLAEHLKNQAPVLLQSFLFHANVIGGLARRKAKIPYHVTGVRVADPRRWRYPVERWATRDCQRVVCVSESVAEFTKTTARIPAEKIEVVPNGVDIDRYRHVPPVDPRDLGIDAGRRFLLFVGRLDIQKGIDLLLDWLVPIFEKHIDLDLVLLGDGPLRADLVQQANALGLSQRIHVQGWQPNVASFMAASACLVLPSRWEGMPNALMEAMAVGIPVLSSDVQGVKEVLGDGRPDQLFPTENRDAFLARLNPILSNPELASRLGTENRVRIEQQFSLGEMVASYQRIYLGLIESRNRHASAHSD